LRSPHARPAHEYSSVWDLVRNGWEGSITFHDGHTEWHDNSAIEEVDLGPRSYSATGNDRGENLFQKWDDFNNKHDDIRSTWMAVNSESHTTYYGP